MKVIAHFVILGTPVSQKNAKKIFRNKKTGAAFIGSEKKVKSWRASACEQLKEQWGGRPPSPKGVELNAAIVSYLGARQRIDADNLYGGVQDALQEAGVVESDFWIRSHNGSDRRKDASNPRVEITLTIIPKTKDFIDIGED